MEDAKYLLKVGWTGRGQTQQLQLAALMVARSQHAEVDLIADEVCELLVGCPGFYDHCGHVEEILRKERPGRSACKKAAFFDPCYEGSWKEAANKKDQKMRLCAQWQHLNVQKKKASPAPLSHLPSLSCCRDMDRLRSVGGTKANSEHLANLKRLVHKRSQ